ncbi:retrovirus-related Pol polyprotein from transposon opus [Nephila pilipes]|uniref:Retrovirus-related Pol polyprotein from transposon opus n=1 Tax=Nephila pilipes TaxID=299642 RepID=A0A8X6NI27_NEPPI|nr:retrovirus-related Pol polyprotein from transposon opus [Nephila pilipes]
MEFISNEERGKLSCYSISIVYRREVEYQVQKLIGLNLIEPFELEIAQTIVCVAKRDFTVMMCTNFWALNAVLKVPIFPLKDMQELIFIAGSAHWLTSLGILKGY